MTFRVRNHYLTKHEKKCLHVFTKISKIYLYFTLITDDEHRLISISQSILESRCLILGKRFLRLVEIADSGCCESLK